MKKIVLFAFVISVFISGNSYGADKSNGCGAGWYVFKDTSLLSSALRGTVNAFLPNTFSMTSGISNCAKHSIVMLDKKSLHLVESNLPRIQVDIAMGKGEYLDALSHTMGCQANIEVFHKTLQKSYPEIFSGAPKSTEVLSRIKDAVGKSEILSNSCQLLG